MTHPPAQPLRVLAEKATFRFVDGVAIRFVESDQRDTDALFLSPWPESLFAYESTWSLLPHIETPVLIASGRRDTVVPPVKDEYLHERLPHSDLHLVDAGHFISEDAADEYVALVKAWWEGGFKRCMERSMSRAPVGTSSR